ncbi:MAG: hypothetical protein IT177_04985 [Acidobacteria bacterium]|nr:hypothetical protein [Acidobacteriota bacterium]
MIRGTILGLATLTFLAGATPSLAQPAASLSIARIFHNGALQVGNNTFRVTVRNTSSTKPILPREVVVVRLIVLDGKQKETTYEARITTGIGTNGDQTAAFPNVALAAPGPYTVTARATTDFAAGRANAVAPDRTQVFNVGGAQAAAANQLTVLVKKQNGMPGSNLRVALKANGRELDWKNTGGTGEAKFTSVAPSQNGQTYEIEVKQINTVLATIPYTMPAQAATYEVKVP